MKDNAYSGTEVVGDASSPGTASSGDIDTDSDIDPESSSSEERSSQNQIVGAGANSHSAKHDWSVLRRPIVADGEKF